MSPSPPARERAKDLKRIEVTEAFLKNNAKIIVTEKGISPQLIIGDFPVSAKQDRNSWELSVHT